MNIQVRYLAQIKRAAGVGEETCQLADGGCVDDLLRQLGETRDTLRPMLGLGNRRERLLLLVSIGDRMLPAGENAALADGDVVTLMTPMSGG